MHKAIGFVIIHFVFLRCYNQGGGSKLARLTLQSTLAVTKQREHALLNLSAIGQNIGLAIVPSLPPWQQCSVDKPKTNYHYNTIYTKLLEKIYDRQHSQVSDTDWACMHV